MNNLTITFRNVRNKRPGEMKQKIINLSAKFGITSIGISEGPFDVCKSSFYNKSINEPKYILQREDKACQLITLLNAQIYKFKRSTIKYGSDNFYKLIGDCGGDYESPIQDIGPALKRFNIKLIPNRCRTQNGLFNWVIKQLKAGNLIDFTFRHPRWGYHSILIVEYNTYDKYVQLKNIKEYVFKTINTQLYTETNPVEYLPWERLISIHSLAGTKAIKFNNQ